MLSSSNRISMTLAWLKLSFWSRSSYGHFVPWKRLLRKRQANIGKASIWWGGFSSVPDSTAVTMSR